MLAARALPVVVRKLRRELLCESLLSLIEVSPDSLFNKTLAALSRTRQPLNFAHSTEKAGMEEADTSIASADVIHHHSIPAPGCLMFPYLFSAPG
jgi:hypothetical protein